ncbi:hypothetical protein ASC72_13580 [Flavobacterium sp. Root420]|nr:hypothetical protein ASC72_13580 [Flavobacterium sp. Root420]
MISMFYKCDNYYFYYNFKNNVITKIVKNKKLFIFFLDIHVMKNKTSHLAPIAAVSPDLEKQSFLAVVFVNREYSG